MPMVFVTKWAKTSNMRSLIMLKSRDSVMRLKMSSSASPSSRDKMKFTILDFKLLISSLSVYKLKPLINASSSFFKNPNKSLPLSIILG